MKLLIALVAALSMSTASAGVTYQWWSQSGDPGSLARGIIFNITFTDAAVLAGHADYSYRAYCPSTGWPECAPDPNSPIESLFFAAWAGHPETVEYTPSEPGMRGFGDLDLSFGLGGDYLAGWIRANNTGTSFSMEGGSSGFTFSNISSDYPIDRPGCEPIWECSWVAGEMRRIPEPSSIALMLLAAGALTFSRAKANRG